jgi:hypothetical protein
MLTDHHARVFGIVSNSTKKVCASSSSSALRTTSRRLFESFPGRLSLLIVAALFLSAAPLKADQVIDFEAFSDGTSITNQYAGVTFTNATVITAGIDLNEIEFPPESGVNVVFDDGGPITIDFDSPVLSFGAYFTYAEPLTLDGFDDTDALVASVTSAFSSNLALSGDPGSSPDEFLEVSDAAGISSVTITGDPAGGSFTMDNATITSLPANSVPEPGTGLLLFLGLAQSVAFWASRSRRAETTNP